MSLDPKAWEAHLPPLVVGEGDKNEILESLDALAQVLRILDIPDASFTSYSTAITNLTTEKFALSRSLSRLRQVEEELKNHLASLKHEYEMMKHWNEALIPGSSAGINPESSLTLERRKDAVVKKAKEYHKELEALLAEEPLDVPITIRQLIEQKERTQAMERELKEKRAKIKAFQGLPPNLELARHELRVARQRQMELIQLRERLLGHMADNLS